MSVDEVINKFYKKSEVIDLTKLTSLVEKMAAAALAPLLGESEKPWIYRTEWQPAKNSFEYSAGIDREQKNKVGPEWRWKVWARGGKGKARLSTASRLRGFIYKSSSIKSPKTGRPVWFWNDGTGRRAGIDRTGSDNWLLAAQNLHDRHYRHMATAGRRYSADHDLDLEDLDFEMF